MSLKKLFLTFIVFTLCTTFLYGIVSSESITNIETDSYDTDGTFPIQENGNHSWRSYVHWIQDEDIWVLSYAVSPNYPSQSNEHIAMRFSDDHGLTWSEENCYLNGTAISSLPFYSEQSTGVSEPIMYGCPNGDLIIHYWDVDFGDESKGTLQRRSTDNGFTWSDAEQVDYNMPWVTNDWIFQTDDYFVYDGVIYAGARQGNANTGDGHKNILVTSNDNATTWEFRSNITSFTESTNEVGLEYFGDDTIRVLARERENDWNDCWFVESTDMGSTWTTPENYDAELSLGSAGGGRFRMYTVDHLKGRDNWWEDNRVVVVGLYMPSGINPRRNVVWTSNDSGVTYSEITYLNTLVYHGGYGDIVYNPDTNKFHVYMHAGTQGNSYIHEYTFYIDGWNETEEESDISIQSINGLVNNSVTQYQNRSFNWTRVDDAVFYQLQISNSSSFESTFVNLSDINMTNYGETYYNETGGYVEFILPDMYNISWYGYHYYRVRAYTQVQTPE